MQKSLLFGLLLVVLAVYCFKEDDKLHTQNNSLERLALYKKAHDQCISKCPQHLVYIISFKLLTTIERLPTSV
jgi:hypothetical protein